MQKGLSLIGLIFIIVSCQGHKNQFLEEKAKILTNQKSGLSMFNKYTNIIDNDLESRWAYHQVDSLLETVNVNDNNFDYNLLKIYSAQSLMFYGMSYTRSITAMARSQSLELGEVSNASIIPLNNKLPNKYQLSKAELLSIYAMVNFYKVGQMNSYDRIYSIYTESNRLMEQAFKTYPESDAYKIMALQNKKLHYKVLVILLNDLHLVNNKNTHDRDEIDDFYNKIIIKGQKLDEIPEDNDKILSLDEPKYMSYLVTCSQVQNELYQLLTNEIEKLSRENG